MKKSALAWISNKRPVLGTGWVFVGHFRKRILSLEDSNFTVRK